MCTYSQKNGRRATCTSHLSSFPSPIYPSHIDTAAQIFHKYVRNNFILHLEQENYFMKKLSFFGVRSR